MRSAPINDPEISDLARLLIALNVIALAMTALAAWLHLGVWMAYACVGISAAVFLVGMRVRPLCARVHLAGFGMIAGAFVLAVDWWLVVHIETLHYAPSGPLLAQSPIYMPFGWAGLILSIGFLGWIISRRHGVWVGSLAAACLSAVLVPTYEILAPFAGWWSYVEQPVILGVVPWKIVIAEFHVGLLLPVLVDWVLRDRTPRRTVAGGIVAGLWLCACAAILAIL